MPFVQAGDVRLHYVQHGAGLEPLVFIHGYTGTSRNWEALFPRIPEGYTAYFFDLRGAGQSDKPANGYGPAIYAADIDAATREIGLDTLTLIGHSMGGGTAMQFAVSYPARLRKLVLVAPVSSNGIQQPDPAVRAATKAIRGNRELMRRMIEGMAVRSLSAATVEQRIDSNLSWTETAYDEAWDAMAALRLGDAVTGIQIPTLMIAGDRDSLRPANLEDAQRIPNCGLQVFYRAGHSIFDDVPDEFMAAIDDFVRHGAGAADVAGGAGPARAVPRGNHVTHMMGRDEPQSPSEPGGSPEDMGMVVRRTVERSLVRWLEWPGDRVTLDLVPAAP